MACGALGAGPDAPLKAQILLPEEVWFEKLPNPLNPWRGLSPLYPADLAVRDPAGFQEIAQVAKALKVQLPAGWDTSATPAEPATPAPNGNGKHVRGNGKGPAPAPVGVSIGKKSKRAREKAAA